jgi:hypothetical protein
MLPGRLGDELRVIKGELHKIAPIIEPNTFAFMYENIKT